MGVHETTIHICSNVRLNSKYEHTIWFPNVSKQQEYFSGKVVKTFSDYSFVRRFYDLEVEATMEEAKSWSYLFLTNGQYPVDYYYYFINRIEYVNPATVKLSLEMDVIQSYMFEYALLPCFVERQHATSDGIGDNTIDEGLDTGEYVNNNRYDMDDLKELVIMALSSVVLDDSNYNKSNCYASVRNGIFNGMGVYAAPLNHYAGVGEYLAKMDDEGYTDAIAAMWMFPAALISTTSADSDAQGFDTVVNLNPAVTYTVNRPSTLDGYTPRNNKLYTFPYSFVYATNNGGASAVYRWELFGNRSQASFRAKGSFTPDGGVRLNPQDYKGIGDNSDEGLILSGFPSCAWSSDEYKIWLAQNRNQQNQQMTNATLNAGLGVAAGVASIVAGVATSNPMMIAGGVGAGVTSVVSGYQQVEGIMAQNRDRDIQPPQAKGSFSSNINIVNGCHTFSFYDRCIRAEYAKQIDDYFTIYGYKMNRVQTPNIHARSSFTYVKTIGCHVHGNLNNEDLTKIESVFNNGVTFWVSGDQIGDYSLTNGTL